MINTDFVNKAINSHRKTLYCLNIFKNSGSLKLLLSILWLFACNLVIAQQQSNPTDKTNTTNDAKNDSSYTERGNKIVNGKDIETTVIYDSKDSIVYDLENKLIYLYGDSKVNYGDRTLNSDKIIIDYTKNVVTSIGTVDSLNKTKGRPVFKEGAETYVADKIVFNFQTKKGVVFGAETKQGEGFISGGAIKKSGDDVLYVKDAIYTTCDRKHPHFGFVAHKIKIIDKKKIISGPGQLQIAGTNLPIFIPFGFFPYPKKRSSGILMPSISGSNASGFGLQGLGVYLAINDYLGLKVLSNVFMNGGYTGSTELEYKVKYRFAGTFTYTRNALINGFGVTKKNAIVSNNLIWQHRQLAKRKGTLSANVNISSQEYNRQNPVNTNVFGQQDFNSSVNYSRRFPKSGISMNVASTYTNNISKKTAQAQLPTVNFSLPNIKPFKEIGKSGKLPLLQNINISPSFEFKNIVYKNTASASTFDMVSGEYYYLDTTKVSKSIRTDTLVLGGNSFLDNLKKHSAYGAKWGLGIYTDVKLLKYFNFRPNFNINGNIYDKYKEFGVDLANEKVVYQNVNSLYAPFNFNFGASLSTMIYGLFKTRMLGLEAIRHTMNPVISYSLQPRISEDSRYYQYLYQKNPLTEKGTLNRASTDINNAYVYGAPSISPYSESINFAITNFFEAKVRNKKDTTGKATFKKVKLIDNLSVSGRYLISEDSFKLSNINVTGVTRLFNKISINGGLVFDPYKSTTFLNEAGLLTAKRVDEYRFSTTSYNTLDLAELRSINFNASTSLNPKWKFKNSYSPEEEAFYRLYPHLRYADFSLPWNATADFNFSETRPLIGSPSTIRTLRLSGNVTLMDSWKVTCSSSYDFELKKWGGSSLGIIKQLHCWQMFFNWMPVNTFATYTFKLTANASTLRGFEPIQKRGMSAF